jgi:hypothetical protein
VVAVLKPSVARPGAQPSAALAPDVLYFGSFASQIDAIHKLHSDEFRLKTSTSVPEFTSLVRAGHFTHIVLDMRDGRLAAQLLLPLVTSLNKPNSLIIVTTLDESETYGLIPRNARILDGAIKEKQLLRLLGLSRLPLKSPGSAALPARANTLSIPRVIALLLLTAITSALLTLAVMHMTSASRKIVPALASLQVEPETPAIEKLKLRLSKAKSELQLARRDLEQAQLTLLPQVRKLNENAVFLASSKAKAEKQVVFLRQALQSVENRRARIAPMSTLKARLEAGKITTAQFNSAVTTLLAFDERLAALGKRLDDARNEFATTRAQLIDLRGTLDQLREKSLSLATARLQDAERNVDVYQEALKQQMQQASAG